MRFGEIADARNASLALRKDGCETVSGHSRIMLGSWSGMVGIVPPLGLEFSLVS